MQRRRLRLPPAIIVLVAALLALLPLSRGAPTARADVFGPGTPDAATCVPGGDCLATLLVADDGSTAGRHEGGYIDVGWSNSVGSPIIPLGSTINAVSLSVRAIEVDADVVLAVQSVTSPAILADETDWPTGTMVTRSIDSGALTSHVRSLFEAGSNIRLRLKVYYQPGTAPVHLAIDYVALRIGYTPPATPTPTPTPTPTATPPAERVVELVPGRCNPVAITHPAGTPTETVAAGLNPPATQSLNAFWRYDPAQNRFYGWSPTAPAIANDLVTVTEFLESWFACTRDIAALITFTMPAVS